MRLDPVYVLAPKPKPPSIPTRRAFLVAGAMFVTGFGIGGACGYASARAKADGAEARDPAKATPALQPSGNAELDELRRLAVVAPLAELMAKCDDFLDILVRSYPDDEIAWQGVGRIADGLLSDPSIANRRAAARWLAQVIERADPKVGAPLLHYVDDLKRVK